MGGHQGRPEFHCAAHRMDHLRVSTREFPLVLVLSGMGGLLPAIFGCDSGLHPLVAGRCCDLGLVLGLPQNGDDTIEGMHMLCPPPAQAHSCSAPPQRMPASAFLVRCKYMWYAHGK